MNRSSTKTEVLLRSVRSRLKGGLEGRHEFPFSVPVIRSLTEIDLSSPVTFFVGANGSGKSTLIEAIAAAAGLPTIGTAAIDQDPTLKAQRELGRALQLVWTRPTHTGFFLRAEDFFGFAKQLSRMRSELLQRLAEIDEEYRDRSGYARGFAELPLRRSLGEMEERYGIDLDANSHGESFLHLFRSRMVPRGLHLLDEPEAALSPHSQLALLAMMGDYVAEGAQFIIATHSPILMAFPASRIYSFDTAPVREVAYEDLEHVTITRDFLLNPSQYLRHLLKDS
jgi:predicted ATPase